MLWVPVWSAASHLCTCPGVVAADALQVLLKYNMQRGVVVIPKATQRAHLEENSKGMFEWRLTNEQKVGAADWQECIDCVKLQFGSCSFCGHKLLFRKPFVAVCLADLAGHIVHPNR